MWKWYVFQGLVMFAVIMANHHWQLTPNGYLAALIGYGVAYGATWLITLLFFRPARRLVGLQDDADCRGGSSIGAPGKFSQPLQQWPRPRIGQDAR